MQIFKRNKIMKPIFLIIIYFAASQKKPEDLKKNNRLQNDFYFISAD